jgi:hypothetical protein
MQPPVQMVQELVHQWKSDCRQKLAYDFHLHARAESQRFWDYWVLGLHLWSGVLKNNKEHALEYCAVDHGQTSSDPEYHRQNRLEFSICLGNE